MEFHCMQSLLRISSDVAAATKFILAVSAVLNVGAMYGV